MLQSGDIQQLNTYVPRYFNLQVGCGLLMYNIHSSYYNIKLSSSNC